MIGRFTSKPLCLVLVLSLLFSFLLIACGAEDPLEDGAEVVSTTVPTEATPPPTEATAETTTEPETESLTETTNEYAIIEKFVDLYNASSDFAITDLTEMDIQGEDYLTEFRLFAFENAVGLKGSVGEDKIQIVNYGARTNDQLRVYARVSSHETAEALVASIVHTLDDTISADDLAFELSNPSSIYLGEAGYISGYINTDYANGGVAGYDVMIDCTRINFQ